MSQLKVGFIRYDSVATQIVRALDVRPEPDCRIGQWRICLTFRGLGATRWTESKQMEYALWAASVARTILADERRVAVKSRANRAIDVAYEDSTLVRGCSVVARWEATIPAAVQRAG